MTERTAACSCGQLRVVCRGEPLRISVCHCLACQRRTGSVLSAQARFARDQIAAIEGREARYVRKGDSGGDLDFRFCPVCGATVYWELASVPGVVAVAIGAFADPQFPPPKVSVYEAHRHGWARVPDGPDIEHRM
mgnify:CR=1 FL=1